MPELKGTIFEILRFSLNDGPGIRTTIFFKGCPLKCSWCHNYESHAEKSQLYFDPEKCSNCGNCVQVCPSSVHSIVDQIHKVDFENCDLSAKCTEVCPSDALKIIGQLYSVDEIIPEVLKDREYFIKSKGGVTISGGEPMQQFHFLYELMKELKKEGMHVCLDTSGFASKKLFEKILPFVDLFHYDIKSFDEQSHKRHTGVGNQLILQNLEFLAGHRKSIILRCPIIPGFNDQKNHFKKLADLASMYPSIQKIDLLPYHNMGLKKACNLDPGKNISIFQAPLAKERLNWKDHISKMTAKPVSIGS